MLEAFRFEDNNAYENEFWLKVFSRILKKKHKHTGEFHYFSFFTIKVNMVILLIVSLFPPLYAGY